MAEFEENFSFCEIRKIQQTHGFGEKLCDFSTRFILENSSQIPKKITSTTKEAKPAVTVIKERAEIALQKIVSSISQNTTEKATVLIINRYKDKGKPGNIEALRRANPKLTREYSTAHKSKGRTVDFAIIMGLKSGRLGFTCQIEDDPLLDLVQAKKKHFPHAEERRLFYVAVTRVRKHVYLIADDQFNVSPFITEIENEGYEIITTGQKYETIKCPVCRTGDIVRNEENGRYKCTNSPYCAKICPRCDDG